MDRWDLEKLGFDLLKKKHENIFINLSPGMNGCPSTGMGSFIHFFKIIGQETVCGALAKVRAL